MPASQRLEARVAEVRSFNRFYTAIIGVLDEGLLDSPYTLTEARVIFELAQHDTSEVVALRRELGLDAGYLSRILARFEADGLIIRSRASGDGRRQVVRLTDSGRRTYAGLDADSAVQIRGLLNRLGEAEQRELLTAMGTIRRLAAKPPVAEQPTLRAFQPGDLGWVVQRHGALYAAEYGWNDTFEALVARIVADYVDHRDPDRERAWIAEVAGEPAGCVFCVRKDEATAQLRLLLVEPSARGLGIGTRLVDECIRFARSAGYRSIVLWTNSVLNDARRIYERVGFELVESEPHHSYGQDLVGQVWSLDLAAGAA
ncbi:MAG TPA: bifunctional helix-turn-helix transcriptional regulator/GNAT family N-acetyltransferase [Actinomycetes bacterium]|nr:bifunctional helix-turn-helix transcriptional regulator/GNAT family N-acetyltransferase [Actinomycetes bacterium]